jgi:hypothetical protein
MVSGDLTCSTPVFFDVGDSAAIKAQVDSMNLAAVTDMLFAVPIANGLQVMIFKVEREA